MKTSIPPGLITFGLICFALVQNMQAVVPAPDGGYPNFTTAEGTRALQSLTTGFGNSAIGWYSLFGATTGNFNTGLGAGTLALNNGDENTATGAAALLLNTAGTGNIAIGATALLNNDSDAAGLGNNNTAVGSGALLNNVDGSENTAVGTGAAPNVINGFNNTYVGDFVGALAPDESNTIRIGDLSNGNGAGSLACFIGGIFNNFQPVGGSVVEVTLDLANDKLGWDLAPSQAGRSPVQRSVIVPRSAPQPRIRPQHQAMLNDRVERLQATVAQQQKQIETLTAQLREQAAKIQKVSAQFELSKAAPQTVLNNQ